jgi:hypothetical protein
LNPFRPHFNTVDLIELKSNFQLKLLDIAKTSLDSNTNQIMPAGSSLNQTQKTWSQLKSIVECSRKFVASLNNDVPSSINFREHLNPDTGRAEYRVYFLAGNQKREITIKYVTVQPGTVYQNKLVGSSLFSSNYLQGPNDKQLTKEEQLLRERKRCSFTGITQYSLNKSGRFLFTERSELFCFDDDLASQVSWIF